MSERTLRSRMGLATRRSEKVRRAVLGSRRILLAVSVGSSKGSATGNHTNHREFASRKEKNRSLRNRAIKELATALAPEPAGTWLSSLHIIRTSRQTLTRL